MTSKGSKSSADNKGQSEDFHDTHEILQAPADPWCYSMDNHGK